jgi:hypothetical protein
MNFISFVMISMNKVEVQKNDFIIKNVHFIHTCIRAFVLLPPSPPFTLAMFITQIDCSRVIELRDDIRSLIKIPKKEG